MKKAAVLSIAAFYLLLTTGMYVCILHCTAEYFVQPKIAMHDDCGEAHEGKEHKPCKDKDGCDCCKKHGSYVLKENIPPVPDLQAPQITVINQHQFFLSPIPDFPVITRLAWYESHAPPDISGKSLVIKFRSILI